MAQKNKMTQAEKAASNARNKSAKNTKASDKKAGAENKEQKLPAVPVRFITASVFICLFVVLLITFFLQEGAIVKVIYNVVNGLIGRAGYIVSIPAFLYLFIIHAFSGKRPVIMRTACLAVFVLCCGCVTHLALDPEGLAFNGALIGELYSGGVAGTTGGLICGSLTMLVGWLCGPVFSYIIFIVAALFTLLGSMQITIPSIVRAVQNRPRADWEQEEPERQEPATVVVNHLANKHIAHQERRRRENEERQLSFDDVKPEKASDSRSRTDAKTIIDEISDDVDKPVVGKEKMARKGTPPSAIDPDPDIITDDHHDTAVEDEVLPPVIDDAPIPAPDIDIPPVSDVKKEVVTARDAEESAHEVAIEIAQAEAEEKPEYRFPPIDLLNLPIDGNNDLSAQIRANTERLNETLASFKIEAHITNVTVGPSVTRYEVELEKGVRLNKLTNSANDIALSFGTNGVRIETIPGKISVVGIEVPNTSVTTVSLREVIDSDAFWNAKSRSSFAVGKDIGGKCIVGNIAKLPHMLIAGTTGSGKSVCMNSLIISLLYKASPDDIKLIMIDPKMVELGIYNGIPHLMIPVVTDPKKAAGSLQWAVTEMMRRYRAMSDAGVRDLESYNALITNQLVDGNTFPQLVVIIDELADLMLVAAKEVEESICRIAQMGRAAGIHLVIATQRPSADVITGVMKANIPSRIAFSVASAMESRIILDTAGAEKLVGKGDMLYAPIGNGKPLRVQGCFVTDSEVEAVTTFVKDNSLSDYDEGVLAEIEKKASQTGNGKITVSEPEPTADEVGGDEMLPAAVDVILETGQASVSMLQRRLKLGYSRAARIVDELEEMGIVGPYAGSKPRAILMTREQCNELFSGKPSQMGFDDLADNPYDSGDPVDSQS